MAASSSTRSPAAKARWLIFVLACSASFITYVHRYSWGVIRPSLKAEYGFDDAQMGWMDSAFNLTYALGQYPGGLGGDIFGPRIIIYLAIILWSIVMIGPALVRGYWKLIGVRLLFGATQAPCYPNLGKTTINWFPASIRTTVQGMVASTAGRAGAAMAPILIGTLLMGYWKMSWQQSLFVLAGFGFMYAAFFWMLFRNRPAEHPFSNEAERELIEAGEVTNLAADEIKLNWTRATKINFGIFLAASFCSTFADNLFVFYMPQYLKEEKGFSDAAMGIFASLPLWGGAIGGLCGGILNDLCIRWTGSRKNGRRIVAAGGKLIATCFIAASFLFQDGRLIMGAFFFAKFFSDWSQPTWWGTVTDLGGPAAGRVFGMANLAGSIGGTVAGPIMGYVKLYGGWGALFVGVGIMYVLTAFCWMKVDCTKRLVGD
jgi:ACS family glucarate transporter-like MFS transporter